MRFKESLKPHFHWLSPLYVPGAGIEPALPKELDFESSASTSSATQAFLSDRAAAKILILFN